MRELVFSSATALRMVVTFEVAVAPKYALYRESLAPLLLMYEVAVDARVFASEKLFNHNLARQNVYNNIMK